ncbi:hypothetical protein J6I39_02885 [bacterium]|nr:hypothetical protein [bacterium]
MTENGCFLAKKGCVGRVNFNLYHYAGNSPVKYTDPDGRYAYSVEIAKGKFVFSTSSLKQQLFEDAIGFAPFGGTALTIMKKATSVRDLNSSEFESIQNDLETYFSDFYGSIGDFCETLRPLSNCISNLSTASSIVSTISDIADSNRKNSDTDIDIITSDVFSKLCNYTISGKSHESVAKKYFIAKTLVTDLLESGKLKYSKDWKNDIKSIYGNDRDTLKLLREMAKQFKEMD